MPKDRDQLTPEEPEDADHLLRHRGQGTGGTGLDELRPADELDEVATTAERRDPR
jgi:hypothetical protein